MSELGDLDSAHLSAIASTPLGAAAIEELRPFGVERPMAGGQILYRAGDDDPPFFLIIEGECDVLRRGPAGEVVVVTFGAGCFLGELNLLTGQRSLLTARASRPGTVLVIEPPELRRLMATLPTVSDVIFRTLAARREVLRTGDGAAAIQIVGSRFSPESLALRAFTTHAHLAFEWIDLDDDTDPSARLASLGLEPADVPAVITQTAVLRRPTPGDLAAELGLTFRATPGFVLDLVVVGTGPAGLAASVYGASEGLATLSLDAIGTGGQAAASSRIENYAGFPTGISGDELVTRTAMQAQRLGARLNSPCEVVGLRHEAAFFALELADGSEVPTRSVIVATGARYRRLAVDDLDRFEGAGVYYAATDLETRACDGRDVVVVGGGNSAGQAALHLAQQGSTVSIAIRRDTLTATMSDYLIRRIDAHPGIDVLATTEVRELHGATHLSTAVVEDTGTGERRPLPCAGLFCFIGAEPATEWLAGEVALDGAGFILTDRSLDGPALSRFPGREPLPYETSLPGVFAAGDVRHGSVKRVAAAVGDGSSAVRSVHEHLAVTRSAP
jgi:thioredoxin reductase (NADPH)